jgi:hypothetical protein
MEHRKEKDQMSGAQSPTLFSHLSFFFFPSLTKWLEPQRPEVLNKRVFVRKEKDIGK